MSMKPLATAIPKVTGKVFGRKYAMLGRLLTQWDEIIGTELANKCQPVKIRYVKPRAGAKNRSDNYTTLEISCSPADATLLHYQKQLILERTNRIFGDEWIKDIKFVPQVSNIQDMSKRPRKSMKSLTEADKKHLSVMLDNIEDPDIRDKLESMATAFLQDTKN